MKHGLWLNNGSLAPEQVVEYGVAAEDAGWDGVFVSDSFAERGYADPFVLLAGIASRTDRVRLGTWVVPLARRQPWQVALDLATLDRVSDGRVTFGAGLGLPEDFQQFGLPTDARARADRLDESLAVIDELWRGGEVSYEGEHVTLDAAELPVTPVQEPRIPVMLAGYWPNRRPFRRGARWDGLMPSWEADVLSETVLREMMAYYREHAGQPGDVLLPHDMGEVADDLADPADLADLAGELGVTWLFTTCLGEEGYELDRERVEAGPPV